MGPNPPAKSSFARVIRWFSEEANPGGTLLSLDGCATKTTDSSFQIGDKYLAIAENPSSGTVINSLESTALISGKKRSG
jgi:hypothetical protein